MKLGENDKKKFGKTTNTWRLKNIILKNEWVNQKLMKKFKNTQKQVNENMTVQNPWDAAKVVIRWKYKMEAIQIYLKKQEKYQINNLTLYLKELEKEQ